MSRAFSEQGENIVVYAMTTKQTTGTSSTAGLL